MNDVRDLPVELKAIRVKRVKDTAQLMAALTLRAPHLTSERAVEVLPDLKGYIAAIDDDTRGRNAMKASDLTVEVDNLMADLYLDARGAGFIRPVRKRGSLPSIGDIVAAGGTANKFKLEPNGEGWNLDFLVTWPLASPCLDELAEKLGDTISVSMWVAVPEMRDDLTEDQAEVVRELLDAREALRHSTDELETERTLTRVQEQLHRWDELHKPDPVTPNIQLDGLLSNMRSKAAAGVQRALRLEMDSAEAVVPQNLFGDGKGPAKA